MSEREHPLEHCPIFCGNCIYYNSHADEEGVLSTCKRLDHKRIRFRRKRFQAYDCGYLSQHICRDFEPAPMYKWLRKTWKSYDDYRPYIQASREVCLEDSQYPRIMFFVSHDAFADGRFLNADGSIAWTRKQYFLKGKLVTEFPDGTIVKGNCRSKIGGIS